MQKNYVILLTLTSFLLLGCATSSSIKPIQQNKVQSIFVTDQIKPRMNKKELVDLFGKPYKESFFFDEKKILHETLYYKEELYIGMWFFIDTTFHFEDGILVSKEQEKEERLFGNGCKCSN